VLLILSVEIKAIILNAEKLGVIMLMLSVANTECCSQTQYAECRYAEFHYAECVSVFLSAFAVPLNDSPWSLFNLLKECKNRVLKRPCAHIL
jgi:hypothetical protein